MMEANDARRTVLIVDDTPDNISILNAALMEKYPIKVATRGKKAIEIAMMTPVDIILLDVMMPEMDGFETCRRLKEEPETRRIPVIFVTARGEIEDESMGLSCGGVDYIAKPISAPIVQARVRTHLALYDQNRALEDRVRERTGELLRANEQLSQEIEERKGAEKSLQSAYAEIKQLKDRFQAESVIERAVITSQGTALQVLDRFETSRKAGEEEAQDGKALGEREHDYILQVLQKTGWRIEGKTGAAVILGLNPSTLRGKMRKYGIRR